MISLDQFLIFKIYIVGFLGSLVAQSFFQSSFGKNSIWGVNRGWQNEIAVWNVFAVLILVSLIHRKVQSDLAVYALAVLSLGFALNHLFAFSREKKISHLQGALANGVGLFAILIWSVFGTSIAQ